VFLMFGLGKAATSAAGTLRRAGGSSFFGRAAVGGVMGAYSSRNEEGWGFAGGIAGGMAAGGYLGKFAPKAIGSWGLKNLSRNKGFASNWSAGKGLGGFLKSNLSGGLAGKGKIRVGSSAFKTSQKRLSSINKFAHYGAVGIAGAMGASLGSSALRSNRPY
jgi:hypothetical protein